MARIDKFELEKRARATSCHCDQMECQQTEALLEIIDELRSQAKSELAYTKHLQTELGDAIEYQIELKRYVKKGAVAKLRKLFQDRKKGLKPSKEMKEIFNAKPRTRTLGRKN